MPATLGGKSPGSETQARESGPSHESVGAPTHLLVCLDGSHMAEAALQHAAVLARANRGRISLVQVVEPRIPHPQEAPVDTLEWEIARVEAAEYLEGIKTQLAYAKVPVESHVLQGRAAEQVLCFAEAHDVDLIAVTSHGEKGLTDWSLASTSEKILARSPVSVLVVPSVSSVSSAAPLKAGLKYERILVPLDSSPMAEAVLPLVSELAKAQGSELLLALVIPRPELTLAATPTSQDLGLVRQLIERNERVGRSYMERTKARLRADTIEATTIVEVGRDVRLSLCGIAVRERVDLIVMSPHGSILTEAWACGSVPRGMIDLGQTPVLIGQSRRAQKNQRTATPQAHPLPQRGSAGIGLQQ